MRRQVGAQAEELAKLSGEVIGACIEVHRHLGPGLLEAIYEECLCEELGRKGIPHERQVSVPIIYKGREIGARYRIDLIVSRMIIIELKSVESLIPVHKAQLLSQLRLTGLKVGLLVNFFVPRLIEGVKRIVNAPGMDLAVHQERLSQ